MSCHVLKEDAVPRCRGLPGASECPDISQHVLISFRESTLPQNGHLILYYD